jgi:hypothetical protein
MNRRKGLAGLILAGLLLISGNLGFGAQALAQSGSGKLTEQQRRQLEQKYQEEWKTREQMQKQQETGARLQSGEKHRRDAEKRQREAERLLREQRQKQGQ